MGLRMSAAYAINQGGASSGPYNLNANQTYKQLWRPYLAPDACVVVIEQNIYWQYQINNQFSLHKYEFMSSISGKDDTLGAFQYNT